MTKGGRQSALLAEIIMAVLFFSLSATVILDVFATAYGKSVYAQACSSAIADAQNLAERIYASDDPTALLQSDGFVAQGDTWVLADEDYTLHVELASEASGAGELLTVKVCALREGETLVEIPSARYIPGEVTP